MNNCPFDPKVYLGQLIGMFHCPVCLEMVIAGLPHPDYSLLVLEEEKNDYQMSMQSPSPGQDPWIGESGNEPN